MWQLQAASQVSEKIRTKGKRENLSFHLHSRGKSTGLDQKIVPRLRIQQNRADKSPNPPFILSLLHFVWEKLFRKNPDNQIAEVLDAPGMILVTFLVFQLSMSSLSACTKSLGLTVLGQFVSLNMVLWCPHIPKWHSYNSHILLTVTELTKTSNRIQNINQVGELLSSSFSWSTYPLFCNTRWRRKVQRADGCPLSCVHAPSITVCFTICLDMSNQSLGLALHCTAACLVQGTNSFSLSCKTSPRAESEGAK